MDKNEQFPGYPHYPASEDITRAGNNTGKEPLQEEVGDMPQMASAPAASDNDADVTADDLQILDATESNMDTTDASNMQQSILDSVDDDGDLLNEVSTPGDISGSDLDVPGSEDDDMDEATGEEDEENNFYSLGGDNHESQEENKGE